MASYKAITAVGQAIVQILTTAYQAAVLANPDSIFADANFALLQAADFSKGDDLPKTGATVYLYRVGVNASSRNLPPRKNETGKRFHPSLPLDLYFLVTPWAASPDAQYSVLGWTMRVLEDIQHIPAALLNQNQADEIFLSKESVELIFDPLSLSDMAILWENLKTEKVLPSVTYVVRGVLIDSALEFSDAKPVQTRVIEYQQRVLERP